MVMSWRAVLARAAAVAAAAALLCAPSGAARSLVATAVTEAGAGSVSAARAGSVSADAAAARAEAAGAEAQVRSLTARLRTADRTFAIAVSSVGRRVADSVLADAAADDARRRAAAAAAVRDRTARALYINGGQAGLVASVLRADDAQDLALRVLGMRRVLADARGAADDARTVAGRSAAAATRAA